MATENEIFENSTANTSVEIPHTHTITAIELSTQPIPAHVITNDSWWPTRPPGIGDYLVALSLIITAITYGLNQKQNRKQRKAENKWKQTQFLFEQASLFDLDTDISKAVKLITGHNTKAKLCNVFNDQSSMKDDERGDHLHVLDKLFNLMERLCYAYKRDILTIEDLSNFEWYFTRAANLPVLQGYLNTYYPLLLEVAALLDSDSTAES